MDRVAQLGQEAERHCLPFRIGLRVNDALDLRDSRFQIRDLRVKASQFGLRLRESAVLLFVVTRGV